MVNVKILDLRIELLRAFKMSPPQRRITGGTVDRGRAGKQMRFDDARRQSAIDPVACVVEPAISVKRPGKRRLSGEILPQPQIGACPSYRRGSIFGDVGVVIREVVVEMHLAALRRWQISCRAFWYEWCARSA